MAILRPSHGVPAACRLLLTHLHVGSRKEDGTRFNERRIAKTEFGKSPRCIGKLLLIELGDSLKSEPCDGLE